ncbi:MAG: CaiB/BaiF CoA transferase family protein [Dehalococcoidia bacterium]
MDHPLAGVRVLEVGGGIAAAFATRWLAGFGADVVRSEGPSGLLTADEEVYLLAGKRRVFAGAGLFDLALNADIVVEDGPPGVLAAIGLDPARLRRERPQLVGLSITPFGQSGPYREFSHTNLVTHAMGGILGLTGTPDRPPLVNGGSQAYYLGGLNGFAAVVAAYFGALVHGEGDWVDISMQECAAAMLELYGPRTEASTGVAAVRLGNHTSAVWGIYPVLDGYGGVCCLARQIPAFFSVVGDPDLLDERFRDPTQRLANNDELSAKLYAWFATKTKQELLELGPVHKVPFGAVVTPRELLENASLRERRFFDTVETPEGAAQIPGRPFLGLPWEGGTLSKAGADTAAVLRDWGVAQ